MQAFQVIYRNTQGTLMRILNAVSRRGLDLQSVHADAADREHRVTLLLDVNEKQVGQLYREWHSIVDVTDVGSVAPADQDATWAAPHPPASAGVSADAVTRAATA
jgi:acetolactate synthase small subunit